MHLVAELVLAAPKSGGSAKSSGAADGKKWRPIYGQLKILAQLVFEFKIGEVRLHIIRTARIECVGKSESCMVVRRPRA